MILDIVKDTEILSKKCETVRDCKKVQGLITDLLDTAKSHQQDEGRGCVGLAANQIGSDQRVIVCLLQHSKELSLWTVMINPVIVDHSRETFQSEEGCLSLEGTRTVERYKTVKVMYKKPNGKMETITVSGFNACIVQHEVDHLNGKLI